VSWFSKLFRRAPAPALLASSAVYTAAEAIAAAGGFASCGSTHVAQVRASALPGLYSHFRDELFRLGVVKWDERFDCNHFASFFVALANIRFFAASFHQSTPAQSLALAEYWYRPGGSGAGHAVVFALTESGPLWLEPQTGQTFTLTNAEQASRFLVKF
jgi:hypothetical protein